MQKKHLLLVRPMMMSLLAMMSLTRSSEKRLSERVRFFTLVVEPTYVCTYVGMYIFRIRVLPMY